DLVVRESLMKFIGWATSRSVTRSDLRRLLAVVVLAAVSRTLAGETDATTVFSVNDSPEAVERMKNNVAELMALTEQQVTALVPAQSGMHFTDCPNCTNSAQDYGNFEWSPADPHHIVCRDCEARYPDNPQYPNNGVLTVRSIG